MNLRNVGSYYIGLDIGTASVGWAAIDDQGDICRFKDVYKRQTVNCPLCRIMRKEGRKRGIRHLRVLYSCEQPVNVPVREGAARRERSNLGTASFVPPIMGQMIAGAVLCELAGVNIDGTEGAAEPGGAR